MKNLVHQNEKNLWINVVSNYVRAMGHNVLGREAEQKMYQVTDKAVEEYNKRCR
tara:strand:+ start:1368 stop:1529 length:162 start_codon:yes stop_codon:yes gene_type:complete